MSDERSGFLCWCQSRERASGRFSEAGIYALFALSYCMLYKLGRLLQFLGLLILPIAMAGNMAGHLTVGQMLSGSGVGIVVFFAGWLLQQATRPR
jgi:hypothetical protein